MPARLLIRADANTASGTGHVMRCLALAQEWQRNSGEIIFAQAETTPALERRLCAEGLELLRMTAMPGSTDDVAQTIRLARENEVAWIVADGYRFDAEYQRGIKETGLRLLFLDDHGHANHYSADYILNQNLSARPTLYASREPYTQLLLGTKYVLLRKEFEKWRDWKRTTPASARKVLVTLGGSDPDNVTGKELECIVIIGGSNPHAKELQKQCENAEPQIRGVIDPASIPELMAWADVAISAGGTTSWELAFMGLPTLQIVLADNQRDAAAARQGKGTAVLLGFHTEVTEDLISRALTELLSQADRRLAMSVQGRRLVDGFGSERVVRLLQTNESGAATSSNDKLHSPCP
jgi:UDP-2,4-diacetamido-2,4,6-trideoxy-beta-L-altropyranose hydrolase